MGFKPANVELNNYLNIIITNEKPEQRNSILTINYVVTIPSSLAIRRDYVTENNHITEFAKLRSKWLRVGSPLEGL